MQVDWRTEEFDQRHHYLVLVLQSLPWSSLALLHHRGIGIVVLIVINLKLLVNY